MKAFLRLLALIAVGPLLAPARDAREGEKAASG
jgi:hypothetical protein